ncbi:MAG: phage portal protein [Magnetococcales bacterium]|nr:phage portal protein [Magnetococcales bacterium]
MGLLNRFAKLVFPSRKASAAGYEAASSRGQLSNWRPGSEGVNSLLFGNAAILRDRSRELVRRNAWASSGVESLVSNLVGTGIKPRSIVTDPAFNEKVHYLWDSWVREADAHGVLGFYGLQALAVRAMVEGGEVLVRMRNRLPSDGLSVPFQIQLLEPEHLPFTLNQDQPNGNRVRGGIEFDRINRRVAYHLYPEHPGERNMFFSGSGVAIPVPASEIVHLYRPLRPGQTRGEPWLTQALVKLHQLDQYDDAELIRKKTAALIAGFVTEPSIDDPFAGENDQDVDSHGVAQIPWSPGTMQKLLPGEDVKFSDPTDVGGQYEIFMRMQLRSVAVAMGIPYEQLSGDLTGVSYSSIRAGLVEFRRRMEQWQQTIIIHQFCFPIWERWMDQAVLSGALRAPGYAARRREYQAVKWIPHGWSWVDPLKDITATVMMIRAGLTSRDQAVAELGYSAEEIDQAIANEQERADRLGLVLDSDPRKRTKTGVEVTTD